MRLWVAAAIAAAACGRESSESPFVRLPLDGVFEVEGLGAPVHVARDQFGVAHIYAQSIGDAAFVQGYVMAHDRLPQMDILRRFGAGTLSELFGALDAGVIDTDLEMRMHRMTPLAEATLAALQASPDPMDIEIVGVLERFTDGVNRYASDLRNETWTLDNAIAASFDPMRFVDWSPIDSLVLGRFQAFALSWTTPFELDLDDLYRKLRATYNASFTPAARVGTTDDLMTIAPVGDTPTIAGFPNVAPDTGSRSDGGVRPDTTASAAAAPGASDRPVVPQITLDEARRTFSRGIRTGPLGALGPHAFMRPYAGSNNWAVGPALTGGPALLATDQHLQLPNPSIFYPTHLIVERDGIREVDIIGVTFPGIPGVILGSNGKLAWSATVSCHDANDVYLERVAPCGAANCVSFRGQQVPIQVRTEEIKIGALGTITETRQASYELVGHHGPIIPTIRNGAVVPRGDPTAALSVRYAGYEPTFEIRAIWKLGRAETVEQGFRALADFTYGSQNWTMIDRARTIGWTTESYVPVREPAAYAWKPTDPLKAAPFFILDGDGTRGHEWVGRLSPRYVPHAIDPAQGYLATANADPVGATFDNDALNQTTASGEPLYVGAAYAAGLREQRITDLLTMPRETELSQADMEAFQHDSLSTVGAKLTPALLAHLAAVTNPAGAPADVAPFVAGLSMTTRDQLAAVRQLLSEWTFATPTAIVDPSRDSAATALFNAWMHYFIEALLADELGAAGFGSPWKLDDNQLVRIVYGLLVPMRALTPSPAGAYPILCDHVTRNGNVLSDAPSSCTLLVIQAMIAAFDHLAKPEVFGSSNFDDWRWGELHRLTIEPLFPNVGLNLPRPGELDGGFPKPGDNFVVNRADQGWGDLEFSQSADGPAQRFVAIADGANALGELAPIRVRWQLPGGVIFDTRSKHYRDLLDDYYLAEKHFDAPYSLTEIVDHGETRWEFR